MIWVRKKHSVIELRYSHGLGQVWQWPTMGLLQQWLRLPTKPSHLTHLPELELTSTWTDTCGSQWWVTPKTRRERIEWWVFLLELDINQLDQPPPKYLKIFARILHLYQEFYPKSHCRPRFHLGLAKILWSSPKSNGDLKISAQIWPRSPTKSGRDLMIST